MASLMISSRERSLVALRNAAKEDHARIAAFLREKMRAVATEGFLQGSAERHKGNIRVAQQERPFRRIQRRLHRHGGAEWWHPEQTAPSFQQQEEGMDTFLTV